MRDRTRTVGGRLRRDRRRRTAELSFGIDCNEPYEITIRSANGGLKRPAEGDLRGFTNLVPYEVSLRVVGGGAPLVSGWCPSAQLTVGAAGACMRTSSEGRTAVKARATASWRLRPEAGRPLVAGRYADDVVITIAPRGL